MRPRPAAKQRVWGAVFLALVAGGICLFAFFSYSMVEKAKNAWHSIGVEQNSSKADVPLSGIQWADINPQFSFGSSLTDIAKQELWKKYHGQKVQWDGVLSDIGFTGIMTVTMLDFPSPSGREVHVQLIESEIPKAASLTKGSKVTFVGLLDFYDEFSFWLSNGTVVNAENSN
jgi:hypothetical protein